MLKLSAKIRHLFDIRKDFREKKCIFCKKSSPKRADCFKEYIMSNDKSMPLLTIKTID